MPFRDVIGHARQVALLAGAVERDTVPPSLLFAGPAGVGKWRITLALAQAVNCLAVEAGDACGVCRSCDRVARGMHVDVVTLSPDDAGAIKLDPVREALARCDFRPFEGRRRVVAVRDADTLTEQAQNALLKSLEEPPPGTMFVLTSAAPDALLRTVRSRTMRLAFARLTNDEVARLLVRDHDRSPDDARRAATFSDGSAGTALAIGSESLAEARALALRLLAAAGTPDVTGRLNIAKAAVGRKDDVARHDLLEALRVASSLVRDVTLVHSGADRRLLANGDLAEDIERLGRVLPPPAARRAFATLRAAIRDIDKPRNAGVKVVADWVAVEL